MKTPLPTVASADDLIEALRFLGTTTVFPPDMWPDGPTDEDVPTLVAVAKARIDNMLWALVQDLHSKPESVLEQVTLQMVGSYDRNSRGQITTTLGQVSNGVLFYAQLCLVTTSPTLQRLAPVLLHCAEVIQREAYQIRALGGDGVDGAQPSGG